MNRLPIVRRGQLLGMLVEGASLRAAARMGDVSLNTVSKLLIEVGMACGEYQDKTLRNLSCRRLQCDEIWSFCYAKEKNIPEEHRGRFGIGDVWTWTAIDADSKLIPCWRVGRRSALDAEIFMRDLASRLLYRIQLTTDGHNVYLNAVKGGFGFDVDYAMMVKLYGTDPESERRYSPAKCVGSMREVIRGNPDPVHISTSYAERANLTMRMGMRRFTRLTNGFSKKIDNHVAAVALHFMYYNFGRIHRTLRVTPAMASGVSDHVWSLEEIAKLSN